MRGTVLLALLLCISASLEAQNRTPWGDPDIQGVWSNQNPTPLERPDALKGKSTLTAAEAAEFEKTSLDRLLKNFESDVPISGELNGIWLETAKGKVAPSRATSMVVDPPDGKVPYTPEGKKRWDATPKLGPPLPANRPEDRALPERCITTDGLLVPNPFYNNVHQIVQAPGYVAILTEMMHEAPRHPLGPASAPRSRRADVRAVIREGAGRVRRWSSKPRTSTTRNCSEARRARCSWWSGSPASTPTRSSTG